MDEEQEKHINLVKKERKKRREGKETKEKRTHVRVPSMTWLHLKHLTATYSGFFLGNDCDKEIKLFCVVLS